jgi:hypothetical protein
VVTVGAPTPCRGLVGVLYRDLLSLLPSPQLRTQAGALLLHLSEGALALVVALPVTTLLVATGCRHLLVQPGQVGTRALAMALGVVVAFLVAAHDVNHLRAILAQFLPGS